jgi:hypothetical protein
MPKQRYTGVAKGWVPAFLAAFANTGNVRASAQAAGISRDTVYGLRERNAEFRHDYEIAQQEAVDLLAAEARRRALTSSDTLLIYLLKVHGGEEYRNDQRRQQEHKLSDAALKVAIEKIAAQMGVDPAGVQELAEKVAAEAWESALR